MSLKRACAPERWNSLSGRVKGTREDAKTLNNYLDLIQARIFEEQRKRFANGEDLSASEIKRRLLGIEEQAYSLLTVFKEHNEKVKQLIGKGYLKATWVKYESTVKHVQEFIRSQLQCADMELKN